jgi:hypothetical protein
MSPDEAQLEHAPKRGMDAVIIFIIHVFCLGTAVAITHFFDVSDANVKKVGEYLIKVIFVISAWGSVRSISPSKHDNSFRWWYAFWFVPWTLLYGFGLLLMYLAPNGFD